MAKAILLFDMPERCNQCEFCEVGLFVDGKYYGVCERTNKILHHEEITIQKSSECPLKPLPEKKFLPDVTKIEQILVSESWMDELNNKIKAKINLNASYFESIGYNECLDDILREQ